MKTLYERVAFDAVLRYHPHRSQISDVVVEEALDRLTPSQLLKHISDALEGMRPTAGDA